MQKNNKSFTELVRAVVKKIPRGKTMSYKEVAIKAGNPLASRAVARIMSQNYNPSIPCHRVIRTDGTLGGYNIGVRKRGTLSQEVVDILEKISYNLNSPCKVKRSGRPLQDLEQSLRKVYSPCNGVEVKRRILQAEGVKQ